MTQQPSINLETNNTLHTHYPRYFDIDMRYRAGANNHQKGVNRTKLSVLIAIRFSIVTPGIVRWLYAINHRLALEHLNRLEKDGFLRVVKTHRSPDGRVYVPTYTAAKFVEELMGIDVYFRSNKNPALQFNHNNVMHNLINAFVMLRGLHNYHSDETYAPMWTGFITEPEFKRINNLSDTRTVDGAVLLPDGSIAAIEVEHSFKNKTARQVILLKYLASLKNGDYSKIFLFSQSVKIFDDIKRLHEQLFTELTERYDKKTRAPLLSESDAELLHSSIIFRTKLCEEINEMFYQ
ncbi:hypothetical protein [Pseudoalteromonas sp. BSi20429]|uniref:hypothetical protein n=1 Tax=Pseudoalteromonas sp. BSi20429 TaxID=1097676 RepID=UPI000231ACE4|nr:hypothetical protein [Pseudoalteromonas sp. BSi20429]GAA67881.1 hypothetical protein P20429_2000 [Pseudoalteromonas sp. BSi20429]